MTIAQISHEAYKVYEKWEPNGREVASAVSLDYIKRMLSQSQREPDPAAFDDDEHAMFLYGTGRF